jgi:ATP-dependent DNA ligase
LRHNGEELRPFPLIDRRLKLSELVARSSVRCLHMVQGFDNGAKLLEAAEGIVSKRQPSAYRSGPSRDWVKIKTTAWRAANRERWRTEKR